MKSDELPSAKIQQFRNVSGFCRSLVGHGGVGIFCKENLSCDVINISSLSQEVHCEITGVMVSEFDTQILTVYRSPSGDFNKFLEILSCALGKLNSNQKIIVAGDFNVHFSTNSQRELDLCNMFLSFGLVKTVSFNTRGNACLDNVFVNFDDGLEVHKCDFSSFSDHDGIIVKYIANVPNFKSRIVFRPITDQGLFELYNMVEHVAWNFVDHVFLSPDRKFEMFVEIIQDALDQCFPLKTKLANSGGPPRAVVNWFNDNLCNMRDRLNTLVALNKTNPQLIKSEIVRDYRRKYRREISRAKKQAHDSFIRQAPNAQKAMWDIIHSSKSKSSHVGSNLLTANSLNDYFSGIAEELVSTLPSSSEDFNDYLQHPPRNEIQFSFNTVSYNVVREVIEDTKVTNSKDSFDLNMKIVKTLKNIIIYPLTKIINHCITASIFPGVLKTAKVVPLYKNKGSKDEPTHYRPISILPIFSKLFEKVLNLQIKNYFESNDLFFQSQYGFRNKRSTTLATNTLTSNILEGFEDGLDTYASFFDLQKAFDCVSHSILLDKLRFYNFHTSSIELLQSYLNGRSQYVTYNSQTSETRQMRHGVPQGSVLGPTLFLIYVNDLVNAVVGVNLLLFADDTTMYFSYKRSMIIDGIVSDNYERIRAWFIANRLSLNSSKTQNLNFSLSQGSQQSASVKFLGVYLDSGMTWVDHIMQLSKRLSSAIFLIRGLVRCVSTGTLLTAYHGCFASHLCYALLVWGHSPHVKKIFGLQRKCVRIIAGIRYRDCCRESFTRLHIMTLPSLYIYQCLCYVRENQNRYHSHSDIHNYPTRHCHNIVHSFRRLLRTRDGTGYLGLTFFNALPLSVRALGIDEFKRRIKTFLLSKAFYSSEEYLNSDLNQI